MSKIAHEEIRTVLGFLTEEVSAIYGEARKDALYCDPLTSGRRLDALATIDAMFVSVVAWLAPILPFTAEELWKAAGREGSATQLMLSDPSRDLKAWNDPELGRRWAAVLKGREAVLAGLEAERQAGRIKTGLETYVSFFTRAPDFLAAGLTDEQFAELCVVSGLSIQDGEEAVTVGAPRGHRCERSWRWFTDVGSDQDYPMLSARDAKAVREWAEAKDVTEAMERV